MAASDSPEAKTTSVAPQADATAPSAHAGATNAVEIAALAVFFLVDVFVLPRFSSFCGSTPFRLVSAMGALAFPAAFAAWRGTFSVLGPQMLCAVGFYLATLHGPALRLLLGARPLDLDEARVIDIVQYAAFAMAFVFAVAHAVARHLRQARFQLPDFTTTEARTMALLGFVASGCAFGAFALWAFSVGIGNVATASYADIYLLRGGETAFALAWPFLFVGPSLTSHALARWPGGGPVGYRWAHLAAITILLGISARIGFRGPTIQVAIAIALARWRTARPLNLRTAILATALLAGLFFVVSSAREELATGYSTLSGEQVEETAAHSIDVESDSEFDLVFRNHTEMVRRAGVEFPFREGESYTDLWWQLLPRQIVGEKPVQFGAKWAWILNPEAASRGGGFAFGAFTEGYLNFGPAGAIVQPCVVTVLLIVFHSWLRSSRFVLHAAAPALLSFSYHFHRSEAVFCGITIRNILLVTVGLAVLRALAQPWTSSVRSTRRLERGVATR